MADTKSGLREITIIAVQNGLIVKQRDDYDPGLRGEMYVFSTPQQLADWIAVQAWQVGERAAS